MCDYIVVSLTPAAGSNKIITNFNNQKIMLSDNIKDTLYPLINNGDVIVKTAEEVNIATDRSFGLFENILFLTCPHLSGVVLTINCSTSASIDKRNGLEFNSSMNLNFKLNIPEKFFTYVLTNVEFSHTFRKIATLLENMDIDTFKPFTILKIFIMLVKNAVASKNGKLTQGIDKFSHSVIAELERGSLPKFDGSRMLSDYSAPTDYDVIYNQLPKFTSYVLPEPGFVPSFDPFAEDRNLDDDLYDAIEKELHANYGVNFSSTNPFF